MARRRGECLSDMFSAPTARNACGPSPRKAAKRANALGSFASMFAPMPRARRGRVMVEIVGAPVRASSPRLLGSVFERAPPQLSAPMRQLPARIVSESDALDMLERQARVHDIDAIVIDVPPRKKRKKGSTRPRQDFDAIGETVEQLESDPFAVPQPIAPGGYRPRECSTDAPEWGPEYQEALADATERASIEAGDDEAEFKRLLRLYFSEHKKFGEWSTIERTCVRDFRERHPRRKRRTETASSETKRAIDDAMREAGEDIRGSAEHLDRLSLGGQAAYWRRLHKRTGSVDALRRAREIEKRNRAKKKRGAGVASHRSG